MVVACLPQLHVFICCHVNHKPQAMNKRENIILFHRCYIFTERWQNLTPTQTQFKNICLTHRHGLGIHPQYRISQDKSNTTCSCRIQKALLTSDELNKLNINSINSSQADLTTITLALKINVWSKCRILWQPCRR